ncbi:MAG: hypothetical protein H7X99_02700 [Saprospiraceae bacterium]|nr:hypothetical protein [Saprospiraceae bacterium]
MGPRWESVGSQWEDGGRMVGGWWECGAIIVGGSWEGDGSVMGGSTTHLWFYPGKSLVKWWNLGSRRVSLAIGY